MIKEGAKTIELTPTNKRSELFGNTMAFLTLESFCKMVEPY